MNGRRSHALLYAAEIVSINVDLACVVLQCVLHGNGQLLLAKGSI